jgi:hypothetical protein
MEGDVPFKRGIVHPCKHFIFTLLHYLSNGSVYSFYFKYDAKDVG